MTIDEWVCDTHEKLLCTTAYNHGDALAAVREMLAEVDSMSFDEVCHEVSGVKWSDDNGAFLDRYLYVDWTGVKSPYDLDKLVRIACVRKLEEDGKWKM